MKPYYELNEETKIIVLELIKTCKKLVLGNINFHYVPTPQVPYNIDFFMSEYKEYWELTVRYKKRNETKGYSNYADIYRIAGADSPIKYMYSEIDEV